MTEAGFGAVEALSWGGVFAPARTPPAIVKRLSDELGAVMKSAEVKASLDSVASFPMDMPHEAFQAFAPREAGRWAELIRRSGARYQGGVTRSGPPWPRGNGRGRHVARV
jgi:tripartite-type tricarboxylate transporter receptor subunit TctC